MRGNGVDNLPPCFDFACPWSDPIMNRLSQFCALAVTLAVLSGCGTLTDHGHVEPAGDAFRMAIDRRELAGAGSLSLLGKEQNRVVPDIQRSRRIPHSDWSL